MNPKIFLVYFVIINVVAYLIMHIDKNNSRNGRRRISEASLLTIAAIGGSIGILVSMNVLHHKTRKMAFKIGVPLILIVEVLVFLLLSR